MSTQADHRVKEPVSAAPRTEESDVTSATTTTTTIGSAWTCACGRVVHGNGGRSSHQGTCKAYHEDRIARKQRNIAAWESEVGVDHRQVIDVTRRQIAEHEAALEEIERQAREQVARAAARAAAAVEETARRAETASLEAAESA